MTAAARPPSRLDDRTCGVSGCTCHHDPDRPWSPSGDGRPCDRGLTPARPSQTTPGVHGHGYHQRGTRPGDGAVTHCPTCAAARAAARQAREARR